MLTQRDLKDVGSGGHRIGRSHGVQGQTPSYQDEDRRTACRVHTLTVRERGALPGAVGNGKANVDQKWQRSLLDAGEEDGCYPGARRVRR